MFNTEQIRV